MVATVAAYEDDDLLALSGLQHLAYCERQWALIHLEQIWTESADTLEGEFFHERVDTRGYECAGGVRAVRSVRVVSRELGLFGIADIVEFKADADNLPIRPVEYKVGRPKIEDWDRVQLTAQAMCLEEMFGTHVATGDIYYGRVRRREVVPITDELRERVRGLARRAHVLFSEGRTPHAKRASKCHRCSLADECLSEVQEKDVLDYWKDYGVELEAAR